MTENKMTQKIGLVNMKNTLFAGALGTLLFASACGSEQKAAFQKDFPADEVLEISMDISSWDIKISASNDKKIHVSYNGKKKDERKAQVMQKGQTLMIQQQDEDDKTIAGQFSFREAGKVTLSIPKDHAVLLDIQNDSGEIALDGVTLSKLSLDNRSGYVFLSDMAVKNASFISDSGDIKMTDSKCTDSDIQTKSAYVTIKNTELGKAAVLTDSGEVGIQNINAYKSLLVETGSGDISLSHKTAPDNLSYTISSGSDDITAQFKNAAYTMDTDGCKQGAIGKGKRDLSIKSDSGTLIVK